MSRTKEFYHDQIEEGARQVIVEPYLFRYFVHFKFNGVTNSILADDLPRILELAKDIVPDIRSVWRSEGAPENQMCFVCEDYDIPFLIFEMENPRY
jgi:hypothetical protein